MPHPEPEHPIFEYHQIDDSVYIGTNACCETHFKQELLDKGVTADISLEAERIDRPHGVDMYLWLPTEDHAPPTRDQVQTGIVTLNELMRLKKKTFIHCKNGHGRAPTFYAAYLILKKGLTVEAAIKVIQSKRPSIHLEPSQIHFLETLKT